MAVLNCKRIIPTLIGLSAIVSTALLAKPPTVLATDPSAESVVVAVAGGAPQIMSLQDHDPSDTWKLESVTADSAQFSILQREPYKPHRVRVFVEASGRTPLVIQDQVKIEPVPRMILTPVQSLTGPELSPEPSNEEQPRQQQPS